MTQSKTLLILSISNNHVREYFIRIISLLSEDSIVFTILMDFHPNYLTEFYYHLIIRYHASGIFNVDYFGASFWKSWPWTQDSSVQTYQYYGDRINSIYRIKPMLCPNICVFIQRWGENCSAIRSMLPVVCVFLPAIVTHLNQIRLFLAINCACSVRNVNISR